MCSVRTRRHWIVLVVCILQLVCVVQLGHPPKLLKIARLLGGEGNMQNMSCLWHRWAKSRDSYCRIASESYRRDSSHQHSLVVICPPKTVAPRFESGDWRALV